MNLNIVVPLILTIILIGFLVLYSYYRNKKFILNIKKDIEEKFGKNYINIYKYKKDELSKILSEDIDDITYNDLNLDEFISKYNHTKSTPGFHYFYYNLRKIQSAEELEKMKLQRKEMLENIEILKEIQFYFQKLGYYKDSVIELLEEKIEIEKLYVKLVYVFSLTPIYIAVGLFFAGAQFLIVAALLIFINYLIYKKFNVLTYGKLNSMINLKNILSISKKLEEYEDILFQEEIKELKILNKKVRKIDKTLRNFKKLSGNVELDFLEMYINVIFLFNARKFIEVTKYLNEYKEDILKIYILVGKLDSLISLTSVFKANELVETKVIEKGIEATNLRNPFLKKSVENNIFVNDKSILLTGSNASGKSTYLRTVGLNLLLAETFGFAFAEEFKSEILMIKSSISISDSILENRSYFMTEAQVIRDMINDDQRKFILLDEIFRGTNTIDRISLATATLDYLACNNIVVVATHDIELTSNLIKNYDNYHFSEQIIEKDLRFDYKLKKGPVKTRNATKILEVLDYPKSIIDNAIKIQEQ